MSTDVAGIRPQPGPQEQFLASSADIVFYGGAAFGGKTFALLLEAVRHTDNPQFGAVIFRRTTKQVTAEGGLWDTSEQIYPLLDARPNYSRLAWDFPSGARLTFAHLEHEKDKFNWQGSQIALIGFDEVTHFSAGQFWYLLSRNRSTCGVRPYVRATCNPDPDSFVAELIAWWIDPETGYAIPERSGVVRWFVRYHDELHWADTPEELRERFPGIEPKSLTFIASSYKDNKIGLERDPGYMANLDAMPKVERERLKAGNWKIRPASGDYFKAGYFEIVDSAPPMKRMVRYWDRAATEPSAANPDPDWTAGVKIGLGDDDYIYICHVERFRGTPGKVLQRVLNIASGDSPGVVIGIEKDPGQAGKFEVEEYVKALAGYTVETPPPKGDKEVRAAPLSTQAEHGRVKLVRGAWNTDFISELENFPKGAHDDQVDAASGGYALLVGGLKQPPAGETAGDAEQIRDAYVPDAYRNRGPLGRLGRMFGGAGKLFNRG